MSILADIYDTDRQRPLAQIGNGTVFSTGENRLHLVEILGYKVQR